MLEKFLGNRSAVHILYFLLVNRRCYGTELKRLLDLPLSPIQKALAKLEESEVLRSYFLGKTRVYELNKEYPLQEELILLLKKAYGLLPPEEKKKYCFLHKPLMPAKEERKRDIYKQKELLRFWERLEKISYLSLTAESFWLQKESLIKKGRGNVKITRPRAFSVIFHERGSWTTLGMSETQFSNSYQWTLDLKAGLISLEHLRYGFDRPVLLFYLHPVGKNELESMDSHLSSDDTYIGKILWTEEHVRFYLRIIGSKKNEQLEYLYS